MIFQPISSKRKINTKAATTTAMFFLTYGRLWRSCNCSLNYQGLRAPRGTVLDPEIEPLLPKLPPRPLERKLPAEPMNKRNR